MGRALQKFAFDKDEATKAAGSSLLGPTIGGVIRGAESGHKTAGFWGGPGAAAGARDRNTGENHLGENMAGIGAVGAAGGAASGASEAAAHNAEAKSRTLKENMKKGKMKLKSVRGAAGKQALIGGAAAAGLGGIMYVAGKSLGEKYRKGDEYYEANKSDKKKKK